MNDYAYVKGDPISGPLGFVNYEDSFLSPVLTDMVFDNETTQSADILANNGVNSVIRGSLELVGGTGAFSEPFVLSSFVHNL